MSKLLTEERERFSKLLSEEREEKMKFAMENQKLVQENNKLTAKNMALTNDYDDVVLLWRTTSEYCLAYSARRRRRSPSGRLPPPTPQSSTRAREPREHRPPATARAVI